jgi:protein SCO1/2
MMAHMLGTMRSAVFAIFVIAITACSPGAVGLSGTDLGGHDAPDFTLTDGVTGGTVTLSSLRGNVVALAFLYTRCPDVCPLTAAQFRAAQQRLGADASRVRFVAVSVDPDGDTPAAVKTFSLAHDLTTNWHYLVGPRAALQAVWSSYGVGAFDQGTGSVAHNDAIYVIDARGRERELVHSDVALGDLVADLRAVLKDSS